ncbi:MAG: N-acetyltransferase [Pseudomonadota bacterium]
MKDIWIRKAEEGDEAGIGDLCDLAFGGPEERGIAAQLTRDGDSLLSLVAHNDREILGHISFFRIGLEGAADVAGLGPMAVHPARQKQGIGAGLVRLGLTLMEGGGQSIVFVLGHPEYYPKFGFSAVLAEPFTAPWQGPAFMAKQLGDTAPPPGRLTYPAAFGA